MSWSLGLIVFALGVRPVSLVARGSAARARVLHRLPDRAVPQRRQPLRLHPDLQLLRRARRGPAEGAQVGHPRRDRDAVHHDRGGGAAARAVRVDHLRLRRDPDPDRHQDAAPAGRRGSSRRRTRWSGWPGGCSLRRRLRRHQLLLPDRARAGCWRRRCCWCCIVVEWSDLVFAIDSIPAIFAVTRDPFLVYSSNVFAILGLRALFFVLAGMMDRFVYLKPGVALILVFVGGKMAVSAWLHVPILCELGVILACWARSVGLSLIAERAGGTGGGLSGVQADPRRRVAPRARPAIFRHARPSLLGPPGTRPPRAPRVGHVRLGRVRHADHDHGGGLPHLLRQGGGRRARRGRRHAAARHGQHDRAGHHRARLAGARRGVGLRGEQEAVPGGFMALGVAAVAGLFFVHTGRPELRAGCSSRRWSAWREVRVLRGAAAPRRPAGRDRPRLDRRVRPGLRRRRDPAGAQPGLDPEPALVRPAGRARTRRGRGDASGAARVPERRGLVAGVLDPAVPAGARAAPPAGGGERAGKTRSGRPSSGWGRPSASSEATGRRS